jgi:hypothetical protein
VSEAAPFGGTAAGTLELQDSTAATTMPTGAYAFVTSGTDSGSVPAFGTPLATGFGGVFNIDNNPSPGDISGNGSLADQDYYNAKATKTKLSSCVPPDGVTGSVMMQPGSLGVVTITLTGATCFGLVQPATIQFTGYIVDANQIRLIESDDTDGAEGFLTAGIAVQQAIPAGGFTGASVSGPYVFGVLGYDVNDALPSSFTSAGVINADGSGNLSGYTDTFFPSAGLAFSSPLTGTYAVDSTLIGRADLTLKFAGVAPRPKPTFLFYLTGSATPPLVLYAGGEDPNLPAIGAGIAYPQAANPASLFFGNPETYGFNITQQNGSENDGTGQMTAQSQSSDWALGGFADDLAASDFLLYSGTGPFVLADTVSLPPADSFGRISGTFMNVAGSNGPYYEYYLVDDNQGFLIETDLTTSGQVALGTFAEACDVTSTTACQTAAENSRKHASKGHNSRSLRKNSSNNRVLKERGF